MVAVMRFHEDWLPAESCVALQRLVHHTRRVRGDIIEIGSWEGKSTIALATAAAPDRVRAVDTWLGSPGEDSERLAASRDVYAQFCENTAHLDNIDVYRMGWRDFAKGYKGRIRLLFIDAEHTYEEVSDTIVAFLPYMREGGIICGDDVNQPPVRTAVLDTLGDGSSHASIWYWRAP